MDVERSKSTKEYFRQIQKEKLCFTKNIEIYCLTTPSVLYSRKEHKNILKAAEKNKV